jgi:hypothetical protein
MERHHALSSTPAEVRMPNGHNVAIPLFFSCSREKKKKEKRKKKKAPKIKSIIISNKTIIQQKGAWR